MKKDSIEAKEKQYIQADKRLDKIRREIHSKKWIQLKEPYQDGWTLYLGLRDDAMRRVDAPAMLKALKLVTYSATTRDPKIVSKVRGNPKLDAVRALFPHHADIEYNHGVIGGCPGIRELNDKNFERLIPEDVHHLYYSYQKYNPPQWGMQEKYTTMHVLNIPRHYVIVKVKRRLVTHIQDINPALLKEEAELENFLEPYWRTCGNRGYKWRRYKDPRLMRVHSREAIARVKKAEIEDIKEHGKNRIFRL